METSELKQQVRIPFDAIANKFGLEPLPDTSSATTEFDLNYSDGKIGLQITVEINQFFVHALIFNPKNGIAPDDYNDENGKTKNCISKRHWEN